MPKLLQALLVDRCPQCGIANPTMNSVFQTEAQDVARTAVHRWKVYLCQTCAKLTSARALNWDGEITDTYPSSTPLSTDLPERAREYLRQAIESRHAASGSVMLSASAVDAMLKEKKLTKGSLYSRIDEAKNSHIITEDMAKWAHQIRLDANDERHADQNATLPTAEDANRSIEFAKALGMFLFILPARVARGIEATAPAAVAR